MKRSPRAGFIPGAWVFPGGTLDSSDRDPATLQRVEGLSRASAQERFDEARSDPPAFAYWVAALREAFEETGILPGLREDRGDIPEPTRSMLLSGETTFLDILDRMDVALDIRAMEYVGHWVTPICEPRRYETRFFVVKVGNDAEVTPFEAEMVDALWLSPEEAVSRNEEGRLPLVFPTLLTLEMLAPFSSADEALENLRGRPIQRRLPEPEIHPDGVNFLLPTFPD